MFSCYRWESFRFGLLEFHVLGGARLCCLSCLVHKHLTLSQVTVRQRKQWDVLNQGSFTFKKLNFSFSLHCYRFSSHCSYENILPLLGSSCFLKIICWYKFFKCWLFSNYCQYHVRREMQIWIDDVFNLWKLQVGIFLYCAENYL